MSPFPRHTGHHTRLYRQMKRALMGGAPFGPLLVQLEGMKRADLYYTGWRDGFKYAQSLTIPAPPEKDPQS